MWTYVSLFIKTHHYFTHAEEIYTYTITQFRKHNHHHSLWKIKWKCRDETEMEKVENERINEKKNKYQNE